MFDWRNWRKGKTYEQIYGKKRAREIRIKQSQAHEGMEYPERRNRKVSKSHMGLRHSMESRRKISRALMRNTNGWIDGSSLGEYPSEFNGKLKERIKERDNHTCQGCGERGNVVHHIDYDKKNNKKSNLITLCESCNSTANFDRDYWKLHYKRILFKNLGVD